MRIAARCDSGLLRRMNEDSIYYNDTGIGVLPNLIIIADGMGGHQAGEKASQVAVTTMVDAIMRQTEKPDDIAGWLAECAEETNSVVYNLSMGNPEWRGMGTTLVAATCIENILYCINVGDSRLYVLEQQSGKALELRKVTIDHSVVEEMVRRGAITKEEARVHPQKNLITRGIGLEEEVEVDQFEEPLGGIQMIMACSDGLSDMMDEKEILKIMLLEENPDKLAERLKDAANEHGGYDNISVIVADMRGE